MRIFLATLTALALFAISQPVQAADFGAPAKGWYLGQATSFNASQQRGAAMTGGQVHTGSVRGLARKRGLALLSLIGRHLDRRLNTERAQAIYLSGQSLSGRSTQDDGGKHILSELGNHLLGVDAQFALGGDKNKLKRPAFATLSATPRRVKLTFKYRW
jgi:hypothetical protein